MLLMTSREGTHLSWLYPRLWSLWSVPNAYCYMVREGIYKIKHLFTSSSSFCVTILHTNYTPTATVTVPICQAVWHCILIQDGTWQYVFIKLNPPGTGEATCSKHDFWGMDFWLHIQSNSNLCVCCNFKDSITAVHCQHTAKVHFRDHWSWRCSLERHTTAWPLGQRGHVLLIAESANTA